jgi:hypothetical protein
MVTKSGSLASLAASLLAAAAALVGGVGVHAADQDQVRPCVPPTAVTVDASGSGACASQPPPPGPSLDRTAGWGASPVAMPGPSTLGEYDVCYLVADSEMEALFQRELTARPSGTRAGGVHDCLWTFDADAMEKAAMWLGPYNGWPDLAGLGGVPVPAVGDEALWVLDGQLWVRVGETAITVMVISDTLDTEDTAIAIARVAVPRIR